MQVFLHRLYRMRPCKPRNPLLRVACGLIGVALLAVLVVFGLFVGLGMLMFAAVRRMFRPAATPATEPRERIIEGEYAVVGRPQVSVHR
jgi:membrane protein implicated in regulation of membrane protease activity